MKYFFKAAKRKSVVNGFYYIVEIYKSDDGKNFYSHGMGEYFNTLDGCEKFMSDYRNNHPTDTDEEMETRYFNFN